MIDILINSRRVTDGSTIWYTSMQNHHAEDFMGFLSGSELESANKKRDEVLSQRAIISRGFLRYILGHSLHMHPTAIPLELTAHGKPVLAYDLKHRLNFNVAHSKEMLIVAVSETSQIGVDVEWIDPSKNLNQVANICLMPEETRFFAFHGNQPSVFFKIWTIKEAILKATGLGLAYPMNKFSVISSKSDGISHRVSGEVTGGKPCVLHEFDLPGNFAGALAEIY